MRALFAAAGLLLLLATPAAAHPLGGCLAAGPERCERWATVFQSEASDPKRADEFAQAIAVSSTTSYMAVNDVAFDTADPYGGTTGRGTVVAQDLATGAERWRRSLSLRVYDSASSIALSPDEQTVYVTGAAYDGWTLVAKDSYIVTTALDAATGTVIWQETWDGRPDAKDNAKVVVASPDGRRVFVGGITTAADGRLDYVVLGYDANRGREKWDAVYSGLNIGKDDVLFDLTVSPDSARVLATGDSGAPVEFDTDVATVAFDGKNGRVKWEHRHDGRGVKRSDRARAITADATRAYVTGDSSPASGSNLDVQTVAIDLTTGTTAWSELEDASGRFDTGRAIDVGDGAVVVTSQVPGPTSDDGLDMVTTARDAGTGAVLWSRRRAQPRTSELANDIAVSAPAGVVLAIGSGRPVVQYTALDEQVIEAYRLADGAPVWSTRLSAGTQNALTGAGIALSPDGRSAVTFGQRTLSADPLKPPSQNIYDAVVAAFDAG